MTEMPKAYSYVRFSTPEQAAGDSYRRQTEMARKYAEQHGLIIDESLTFQDLGVSAFRGRNANEGKLADFLAAVREGIVAQGSYLLVENLDRMSRQTPRKAANVLGDIVEAGITVVTLNDGKVYTEKVLNEEPFAFILVVMMFLRGHDESLQKARRLRAAWENKRRMAAERPLTARCPAWLRLRGDRSGYDVIEDRGAIVRRIYEMAAEGIGQHKIAATLNADGIPTWGDAARKAASQWRRSYIVKLLRSPAVIGLFVPHTMEEEGGRKMRRAQDPVSGYFPVVVPEELFRQVQALGDGARAPGRGRHAGLPTQNVLGGLAKCGRCGSTMTRVYKGNAAKAGPPYLICEAAKGGKRDQRTGRKVCEYRAIRLTGIEEALQTGIADAIEQAPLPAGADTGLDALVEGREMDLARLERRAREIADTIAEGGSRTLVQRLRELEGEQESIRDELEQLRERRAAAQGAFVERRMSELQEACEADPIDRAEINLRLRAACSSVTVNFDQGTLEFEWSHGAGSSIVYDDLAMVRAALANVPPN